MWLRERDSSPVAIIRREVLARHRRALIIYGEGHFWRNAAGENLVTRLEAGSAMKVFTISTPIMTDLASIQPDVAKWEKPSLASVRGTVLGAAPFSRYFPLPNPPSTLRLQDQVDAILYLGQPSLMTTSRLSSALCQDHTYVEMRVGRMDLDPGPPGAAAPLDRLKQSCAIAAAK